MFRLKRERCATCILNPAATRIPLSAARITEFIKGAQAKDTHVVCHDTLDQPKRLQAACRGYYDQFGGGQLARIARRLGAIEETE